MDRPTPRIARSSRPIVTLAHNLGMDVVAEGVETAGQWDQLDSLGCEYGQGYYFSRPMDSSVAESLLARPPHMAEALGGRCPSAQADPASRAAIPFSARLRPDRPRRNAGRPHRLSFTESDSCFIKTNEGGSDVPRIRTDGVRHLDGYIVALAGGGPPSSTTRNPWWTSRRSRTGGGRSIGRRSGRCTSSGSRPGWAATAIRSR